MDSGSSFVTDHVIPGLAALTAVAVGVTSLPEANMMRRLSLHQKSGTIGLGNFTPVAFVIFFSSNTAWWVFGIVLSDIYLTLSQAINVIMFLYYIVSIINILNRPALADAEDEPQIKLRHDDGEEGALRAFFRLFDKQVDSMGQQDRDRTFERRKTEFGLFLTIIAWIFYSSLYLGIVAKDDLQARIDSIGMIASVHGYIISIWQVKLIYDLYASKDPRTFSLPMQISILFSHSCYVVWGLSTANIYMYIPSGLAVIIAIAKTVVWFYVYSMASPALKEETTRPRNGSNASLSSQLSDALQSSNHSLSLDGTGRKRQMSFSFQSAMLPDHTQFEADAADMSLPGMSGVVFFGTEGDTVEELVPDYVGGSGGFASNLLTGRKSRSNTMDSTTNVYRNLELAPVPEESSLGLLESNNISQPQGSYQESKHDNNDGGAGAAGGAAGDYEGNSLHGGSAHSHAYSALEENICHNNDDNSNSNGTGTGNSNGNIDDNTEAVPEEYIISDTDLLYTANGATMPSYLNSDSSLEQRSREPPAGIVYTGP
jgi:hypothetical protein